MAQKALTITLSIKLSRVPGKPTPMSINVCVTVATGASHVGLSPQIFDSTLSIFVQLIGSDLEHSLQRVYE